MRTCTKCNVAKHEECFRLRKSVTTGLHYRGRVCKTCHQKKSMEWRKDNAVKVYKYGKKSRNKNIDYYRTKAREYHFARKFGVTLEQRDEMLLQQGGRCLICNTDTPGGKGWCIDHCHGTGEIRSILCSPCNLGIGHLGDNPDRLRAAAEYIERFRK